MKWKRKVSSMEKFNWLNVMVVRGELTSISIQFRFEF